MHAADAVAILTVSQPWARVAADQRSAEIYMEIRSSEDATLVDASTFAAAKTSIRLPGKRANPLPGIALAANAVVQLAPAGFRIALAGLTKSLKLGDQIPISLTIMSANGNMQDVLVTAEVRRHSATEDELHTHNR